MKHRHSNTRESSTPADSTFTKEKERTIFAQRDTIWELDVIHKNASLFCDWIILQHPSAPLSWENQLHEMPENDYVSVQLVNYSSHKQ